MANNQPNFSRFLVYILGGLVSLVSYLGSHKMDEIERNQTKTEVALQSLRDELARQVGPVKEQVTKDGIRLDSLEKSHESFSNRIDALAEERGRRLADVEKSVGQNSSEILGLNTRVGRIEGHEDAMGKR